MATVGDFILHNKNLGKDIFLSVNKGGSRAEVLRLIGSTGACVIGPATGTAIVHQLSGSLSLGTVVPSFSSTDYRYIGSKYGHFFLRPLSANINGTAAVGMYNGCYYDGSVVKFSTTSMEASALFLISASSNGAQALIVRSYGQGTADATVGASSDIFVVNHSGAVNLGQSTFAGQHNLRGTLLATNAAAQGLTRATTFGNFHATQSGNSMIFGSSNPEYNGVLGCYTGGGVVFIGAHFYHSSVNNELRRSGTTVPQMILFHPSIGMQFFLDASGTGDTVWAPSELFRIGTLGDFTMISKGSNANQCLSIAGASSNSEVLKLDKATSSGAQVLMRCTSNHITGTDTKFLIMTDGSVTLGSNANANDAQHVIQNNSLTQQPLLVRNMSTSTSSDGQEAIVVQKGSTTNTTAQFFMRFTVNAGLTSSGRIVANGASLAAFAAASDARLKENIIDLPPQLDNIMALRPVEFDYIDGSGHQIGFIAQEIMTVYPDGVSAMEDGMYQLAGWSKTEARLVKALQELKAENDALKARLDLAGL